MCRVTWLVIQTQYWGTRHLWEREGHEYGGIRAKRLTSRVSGGSTLWLSWRNDLWEPLIGWLSSRSLGVGGAPTSKADLLVATGWWLAGSRLPSRVSHPSQVSSTYHVPSKPSPGYESRHIAISRGSMLISLIIVIRDRESWSSSCGHRLANHLPTMRWRWLWSHWLLSATCITSAPSRPRRREPSTRMNSRKLLSGILCYW